MLIVTLAWSSGVWGNEFVINGTQFNVHNNLNDYDSFSWGGNHAIFTLSGLNGSKLRYFSDVQYLKLYSNSSYRLSWSVNTACTINVTSVTMETRSSLKAFITLNGTRSGNLYGTSHQSLSTGSISKGGSENVSIVTEGRDAANIFVRKMTITYTITPDAPTVSPTTESVSVTLDENDPQEINLSSYFSSTALTADSHFGSLSYNNSGGTISDGKFYATSAGTYTVKAYLAAQNSCHEKSSDSNALTITVNRRTGSIIAKNGPFSMTAKNTMDLSSCISSSLGTGTISYEVTSSNKNSAVISGSNFTPSASGTYTIKATKAQDSQYATANTTFDITVNKIQNTLTVSNQALKVRETTAGYANKNNLDTEIQSTINNVVYYDEAHNQGTGVISYDESENIITALNAGTAKLRIHQEATDAYEGFDETVTVEVTKYDQTISWNNESAINTSPKVDDTQSVAATASSHLAVSYLSSNTDVLTVDASGNMKAKGAGTATITVSQAGDAEFNAATSITKEFTVSKHDQTLSWTIEDFTILPGETLDKGIAKSTSGLDVTFSSDDTDVISIDSEGRLVGVTEGTAKIKVSQSGDNKYNAAEDIEETFTVSKKQAKFTPAWWTEQNHPLNTDIKVGTSTTIVLTNISTDETFTITPDTNPTSVVSWSRSGNILTIYGEEAGTIVLTLEQKESLTVSGSKVPFTITVSRYPNSFAIDADSKEMKVGEEWTGVVTNTGNNNTQVSYTDDDESIAIYDAVNNSIIAKSEGTTTITFTQEATATHAKIEKSIDVTVTKVTNTLSVSLSALKIDTEVGKTIPVSITGKNNSDPIIADIIADSISNIKDENNGVIAYDYNNGVITVTACNAGKARIKFSQPATTKYTGYESKTYIITVSKLSNNISIKLNNVATSDVKLKYNSSVTLSYTRSNMDTTPTVSRSSGSATTITGNTISSSEIPGTDIYEIKQAETYKYEAGYATFAVRVDNTEESVGYVLYENAKHEFGGWNPIGSYTTDMLSGPADMLSYEAYKPLLGGGYFFVMASKDGGSNFNEIDNPNLPNDNYGKLYKQLDEDVNRVKFETRTGATLTKYMNNIFVTRKTYVRASSDITNMGTLYTDQDKTATFTVKYSSTNGGNISITSSNKNFVPSITEISVESEKKATAHDNVTYICGVDGTKTFTVKYTPDPDQLEDKPAKDESAAITIRDKFHTQQITLTATYRKYDTTIGRGSNTATETTVDGQIANAFAFSGTSAAKPTADSNDDFYYTISHTQTSGVNNGTGVISYDPATNTVKGLNQGTARLTIYQKKTNLYHATSKSFDFTVSKLENNVTIALSGTTMDVDGTVNVVLTNDVSKGAISTSFSGVTYTNESQNRDGGFVSYADSKITGVNAGTGTVKVTQAETYKYEGKSQEFTVTVNKLPQTLSWDDPYLVNTIQKDHTLSGNTATSNVGLTPVTYASDNIACITVDATTGELTAVAAGSNVTITASQAGNYKYQPATLTRQFSVFEKKVPVFTPDAHFVGNEGRVEITGSATITVTDVSDGNDFSITGYDNTIISVSRDGETITITGLTIGNTTLTLAQAGNDNFITKSQTYEIEVYLPDDFLMLSSTTAPTHAAGNYKKIFFTRTLKKGYSTIALPFNTTVETLTGREANDNDWVAQLSVVTYNGKDGYSLYFSKSNAIEANQPYILHLGTAVESPVFTNVNVVAAEPATQNATKGVRVTDWTMHSNYDPAFDMNGYYGVVNGEGVLKKGSTGSTLKAFHAYITGPAAAGVKAAYLDEDEADAILELLKGEATEPENIYDLQGRQLPRAGKGINIIRNADGTVRKVMLK